MKTCRGSLSTAYRSKAYARAIMMLLPYGKHYLRHLKRGIMHNTVIIVTHGYLHVQICEGVSFYYNINLW